VERNGCDRLLLELLRKEATVVFYCLNYCGKKQLWSVTVGITVERSSCDQLLLELLWKEAVVVSYCCNCCGKKQL